MPGDEVILDLSSCRMDKAGQMTKWPERHSNMRAQAADPTNDRFSGSFLTDNMSPVSLYAQVNLLC